MKRTLVLCLTILLPLLGLAQTWSLKNSSFPYAGINPIAPFVSVINGKAYMGTEEYLQVYDPVANTYVSKTPPPCMHCGRATYLTLNNKAYVMDGDYTFRLHEYDPAMDTWALKTAIPTFFPTWPPDTTQGMGSPYPDVFFSINNKGYVGGFRGMNIPTMTMYYLPDFYEYDAVADTYIRKADIPMAFNNSLGACVTLNGKGYVFGGFDPNPPGNVPAAHAYVYNPATDTWDTIAKPLHGSLYTGGQSGAAFALDSLIYYGLSTHIFQQRDSIIEAYSPATNTWSVKPSLPTQDTLCRGIGFAINGKGYVGLGFRYTTDTGSTVHRKLYEYGTANPSAVSRINSTADFSIGPNPAHGSVSIAFSTAPLKRTLTIADMSGKEVMSSTTDKQRTNIDISALPAGTYILRSKDDAGNDNTQKLTVY